MPWITEVIESRQRALELLSLGLSGSQVSAAMGVSRQTIQKWKKRYAEEGSVGLTDRSHAPLEHPNKVSREMERLVVKFRKRYGDGPRKLQKYLIEQYEGDEAVPAASSIGRILKRHGLVETRRVRRRKSLPAEDSGLTVATEPNDIWCIDFKGEFDVGGTLCYPLTVTDAFSRFAIATKAERGTKGEPVARALMRCFRRYGLPKVIRSDNGSPFVSYRAPRRLSRLSVQWLRLGIRPEPIDPGRPYQNGTHERYHKTLKAKTAKPPAVNFAAQQKRFDRFLTYYNHERPHESLAMRRPSELYTVSPRSCPKQIPDIEHKGAQLIRRVNNEGRVGLRGRAFILSTTLAGETVGITEIQDDIYEVTFGYLAVAHISFRETPPRILPLR